MARPAGFTNASTFTWGAQHSTGNWYFTATYDWSSSAQLSDFVATAFVTLAVSGGRLIATATGTPHQIVGVRTAQAFRCDSLTFAVRYTSGGPFGGVLCPSQINAITNQTYDTNPALSCGHAWWNNSAEFNVNGSVTQPGSGLTPPAINVDASYIMTYSDSLLSMQFNSNTAVTRSGTFTRDLTHYATIGGYCDGAITASYGTLTITGVVAGDGPDAGGVTMTGSASTQACTASASLMVGGVTMTGTASLQACTASASVTVGNSVSMVGSASTQACSSSGAMNVGQNVIIAAAASTQPCSASATLSLGQPVTMSGSASTQACIASAALAVGSILKQSTTRCYFPSAVGAYGTVMAQAGVIVRGGLSVVRFCVANKYAPPDVDTGEHNTGGVLTCSGASFVDSSGNRTRITWNGGASSVAIADGDYAWSDAVTLSTAVPVNASGVLCHAILRLAHPSGIPMIASGRPQRNAALGDAIEITGTDKTMAGTIIDSGLNMLITPVAIIGDAVSSEQLCFIGNSRSLGYNEGSVDSSGDTGELARPYGPYFPYCCIGTNGESAAGWLASHDVRLAIMLHACSKFVLQLGEADIFFHGATAAQVEATILSIAALFPAGKFFQTTKSQYTSGSWTNADGSDQTQGPAELVTLNTWIRTDPSGIRHVEIAAYQTDASGRKWLADGTPDRNTHDGLHATAAGNLLVVANPSTFTTDIVSMTGAASLQPCTASATMSFGVPVTMVASAATQPCTALAHLTVGNVVSLVGAASAQACTASATLSVGQPVTMTASASAQPCAASASLFVPVPIDITAMAACSPCAALGTLTVGEPVAITAAASLQACTALAALILGGLAGWVSEFLWDVPGSNGRMKYFALNVDTDTGCQGVQLVFRFTDTFAEFVGLSVTSITVALSYTDGCVVETAALERIMVGNVAGARWGVRGARRGIAQGNLWFRLSDGQHVPSPKFQIEVSA